ncbi:MlaD family protein [Dongia mobilis]|uniref:MlaD family protein n=1 Tax=Dongia sp. TaxID=1977262 RepID=UPI0026ED9630
MRNHFLNYTAVGIFVAAMIAALVVALSMLSGRTGPTDTYFVVLDDVTDVKYGTVVRFAGFPIGQVEKITPENSDGKYRFRLQIAVQEGWKFPQDSIARIAASSFLAGKTLEVNGGLASATITPGGEIAGGTAADMFSLMAQVAGEIGDLSKSSLRPLVAKIGDIIDRIGNTTEVNLKELMGSLNEIAREVNAKTPVIVGNVETFSSQLNVEMAKVDQLLSEKNLGAIESSLGNIERATANAEVASQDLRSLGGQITKVADQISALVADNRKSVDKSIADLEYTLRAVAQNIDSITHNLDGTTRNMNEFSRLIRQHPGLLLSGSNPETDKGLSPNSGDGAQ